MDLGTKISLKYFALLIASFVSFSAMSVQTFSVSDTKKQVAKKTKEVANIDETKTLLKAIEFSGEGLSDELTSVIRRMLDEVIGFEYSDSDFVEIGVAVSLVIQQDPTQLSRCAVSDFNLDDLKETGIMSISVVALCPLKIQKQKDI